MITISKINHKEEIHILLKFEQNDRIYSLIKSMTGVRYSASYQGWYIGYDKESWHAFVTLGLSYQIEKSGTTGSTKPISDDAGTNLSVLPPDCTKQAADATISIRYIRPHFYLRGLFVSQIPTLKSIRNTYWNDRYKNWVIPATPLSLHVLYADLKIISEHQHDIWANQVDVLSNPQICTLYSSPEFPDKVLIQLNGHGVDIDFVKHIPERQYNGDKKIWLVPSDTNIITRITDHYVSKGTKVINRIKLNYVKSKKPTYSELKTYLLSKSADNIHYACIPYIDTLITQRYSIATIREYYTRFAQYVAYLHPRLCDEVNEIAVNAFVCEISSKKVSESLINSYINAIKFYYEKVIYLPQLKIERIKRPRQGQYLPKVLSLQQVDATLRATANLKHTTLLFALYGHGIRLNELVSLRVDDMLWDRNQIFVHLGKGSKDRYVPMSQEFKSILQIYIHEYKPQYWLIEGQDQKSQYSDRSVQQVVSQCAKKAGVPIKVTPHTLRHSYATHLLDAGTQLPYIKELLGHKDIKTTMIYTHVTTASIANVVSPLDRLRKNE
jgi:site-specific recombinase XerD